MNSLSPQSRDETDLSTRDHASRRPLIVGLVLLSFTLLLGACSSIGGGGGPVKTVTKGDQLAYYDFSSAGTFEEGSSSDGKARWEIREGAYHMDLALGDGTLWYAQWGDSFRDSVTDVDANESTDSPNTTYGVMCRVRGIVGQVPKTNDTSLSTLAAEANTALLPSAALTLPGTAEATSAATANPPTAEPTTEVTAETTAASTSEATSEATAASTAEATQQATSEATAETTAAVTEAATTEATAVTEATEQATVESTPEATPESAPTLDTTNVNNGDGYLFLIQGSGKFAIMKSSGRKVTPLVDWTGSSSIKAGAAQNHIRAICMGSYLAMYINGDFMADASDDTYNIGQVGLAAAAADQLGNSVAFDNLTISEAKSG